MAIRCGPPGVGKRAEPLARGLVETGPLAYPCRMTDWVRPVPLFDGEDEAELKARFAELWARYPNQSVYEIGLAVFRDMPEPHRGSQAGHVWSKDLEVLQLRDELSLVGGLDDADLPTKEQVGRELIAMARTARDPKVRLDAYSKYCEVAGYVTKGGPVVNLNDNRVVNVLKVPMRDATAEDDADFDRRFKEQQTRLVADVRSSRPN